ncbi:NUDIX hydrolase [Acuticoccus mangrovi]|uniref:NUDIX hydrolase n=1 Tax=Acuticoccus mangrovi TaxID=2796142 RepID=A0A934MGK4_9HYPH|nr:NUDIX hydrolase [Acuticoccus mangrovi]MBJ3776683.1 NUDIX hydrolase [Acuticoccus mangrovi]
MPKHTPSPVADPSLRPVVAAIAIVLREGRVLLVQRANPPDAGRWGFPGGKIEGGETVREAAVRELKEETGIVGEAQSVLTALDAFDRDGQGRLRRHFVLVAVVCRWITGEPAADDDALDARWFPLAELEAGMLPLSIDVAAVARQAATLSSENAATS